MWKSLAVVAIAVVVIVGWLGRATGQVAPGAPGDVVQVDPALRGADGDGPRRAARDFSPWIEDIILQKTESANRLFPLRRYAQDAVESTNAVRIYRKFPKMDGMRITLVGWRALNEQAGVLLFTAVTEQGPVAFKIYHFEFGNNRIVGRIEITDDWSEIERMYTTIDPLQAPVTVPL